MTCSWCGRLPACTWRTKRLTQEAPSPYQGVWLDSTPREWPWSIDLIEATSEEIRNHGDRASGKTSRNWDVVNN